MVCRSILNAVMFVQCRCLYLVHEYVYAPAHAFPYQRWTLYCFMMLTITTSPILSLCVSTGVLNVSCYCTYQQQISTLPSIYLGKTNTVVHRTFLNALTHRSTPFLWGYDVIWFIRVYQQYHFTSDLNAPPSSEWACIGWVILSRILIQASSTEVHSFLDKGKYHLIY